MPSLFGWLDKLNFWNNLSYPTKGALLRAFKAGAAAVVGVLLAALTDGTLLPEGSSPFTILVVTAVLQAADKFIREWQEAKELDRDIHADVIDTDTTTTVAEDQ